MDDEQYNDIVIDELSDKQKIEIERSKWRGRRTMAWVALFSIIITLLLLLFAPIRDERITILQEPIVWFFMCMTSVIGAYMGCTVWATLQRKSN